MIPTVISVHRAVLGLIGASGLIAASLTVLATQASAAPDLAPLVGPDVKAASGAASVVPGSYIVVLKDTAGLKAAGVKTGSAADVARAAAARGKAAGGAIGDIYTHILPGYSAALSSSELTTVRQDPAVKYLQRDLKRGINGAWEKNVDAWGIDRIDQRSLPLTTTYYYSARGTNVAAYVMDTGIYAAHLDFNGRVQPGVTEIGSGDGRTDCNGHGTHVAGTIGGQYYGVAKNVALFPVRVLDCDGNGVDSKIIAGMDWIKANHSSNPSIVNMSLGGEFSQAFNDAVQGLVDANLPVVVAAGNEHVDACSESPSSTPSAITVAASTRTDGAASFSNYGPCVDIYAPGVEITSDVPGAMDGQFWVNEYSGTSQAAPHVTGVAALYLEKHPTATPAQVAAAITAMSSKSKITNAPSSTTKDLLFSLETVPLPTGVTSGDRLLPGQSLLRGPRLYSSNAAYFLAHRASDGWLCLFTASTGGAHWCSGHSAAWTNMNTSGSLSSYDSYGRRAWSTNTPFGASTMIVNSKGYIMIKRNSDGKVLWTSPH
jgi:subtilisin family serine protease